MGTYLLDSNIISPAEMFGIFVLAGWTVVLGLWALKNLDRDDTPRGEKIMTVAVLCAVVLLPVALALKAMSPY